MQKKICTAVMGNKTEAYAEMPAEPHDRTKEARIVEVQESNTGGCLAVQCSSGNLPTQVGAEVVHQKLGVTCYHQPAMTMQTSDFACRDTAIPFVMCHCLTQDHRPTPVCPTLLFR